MNKLNKKGFTLVELLAVIIVLIIIILLAVTIVKKYTLDAKEKAIEANAISYNKGVSLLIVNLKRTDKEIIDGGYTIEQLNDLGISISGDKPDTGFVYINKSSIYYSCYTYGDYVIVYKDSKYSTPVEGECDNGVFANFDYTGSSKKFTASETGNYKVELWGAQGGDSYYNDFHSLGGYGAYSVGYIHLDKGDSIYLTVGSQGTSVNYKQSLGQVEYMGSDGYNGGGAAAYWPDNSSKGGGGGATTAALTSGLLTTYSNDLDNLLMVAAGGGGSSAHVSYPSYSGQGGHGGGFKGVNGITSNATCYNYGTGATQTGGGSYAACASDGRTTRYDGPPANPVFGKGSNNTTNNARNTYGGGGGGLYGGGSGYHAPGGGGSGYIGNSRITDKEMFCFDCEESNSPDTLTTSTTCVSDVPTEECAKIGNGYARVSLQLNN